MLARSALFLALASLNFLVQAILFSPLLLLPERLIWPPARFWVRSTLWLHRTILGIDEQTRGRENIPAGGFLLACKHQSAWETLRLAVLVPRPAFILKRELLWAPLFGWYLRKTGMIPVNRGARAAALDAMAARARRSIAEGRQVIIFPEGTRQPPLAPARYRYGVTRLYQELDVACLPVALNSGLFWPRRTLRRRRGVIVLACLEPIPPGLPADVFAATLERSIETASTALVVEAQARDPSLPAPEADPR